MELISSPPLLGASLVGMGFLIGLSGASIPGPMLAYVISDTLKKGALSGPLTVLGHITVESFLIFTLVLGLRLTSLFFQFKSLIYVIGGIILMLMSIPIIKSGKGVKSRSTTREPNMEISTKGAKAKYAYNSSIFGGILFTAFNPSFIPWWLTLGYPLLLQGFEWLALSGIILVTAGHFVSDLAWYSSISYSFSRGEDFFVGKRYEVMMLVLAFFIIAFGVFFFTKGITGFS